MSAITKLLALSAIEQAASTYVDDVFSAYTYTGNGSTQTITNGIDLAGKGGMVWSKSRQNLGRRGVMDSARGISNSLSTDLISAQTTGGVPDITAFTSTGYSLQVGGNEAINVNNDQYVSWTFRRSPKFFDVVTWTGDGVNGRVIPHALGIAPGLILFKRVDIAEEWSVWHKDMPANTSVRLNSASFFGVAQSHLIASVEANSITVTNQTLNTTGMNSVNTSGGVYVAYFFAHDPAADGIIKCGVTPGETAVNLGWEPQYVLVKGHDINSDWQIFDSARGIPAGSADYCLSANTSDPESSTLHIIDIDASGFTLSGLSNSYNYIYVAIRRPNKPATSGTQVYNAVARTGTGAAATISGVGFAPDLVMSQRRTGTASNNAFWSDRLRGADKRAFPYINAAENFNGSNLDAIRSFDPTGITIGADGTQAINGSGNTMITHMFRRAQGVFDIVAAKFISSGSYQVVKHSLGVVPELVISKVRSAGGNWGVLYKGSAPVPDMTKLQLNTTAASFGTGLNPPDNGTAANATNLDVTFLTGSTVWGATAVAYLFATLAGISKVFSYTGNGTSQTIDCGFAGGARFVMIKRTDDTGDWYLWDTERGIVAGNDPHISLNTTASEVTTDDSVDPSATGFIVNQVSTTNINVTAATYIGVAIA